MSIDYRIIASSEAVAVFDNPANHEPHAPLGSLGDVRRWLAQRVVSMTPNGGGIRYRIGTGQGGGPVSLRTVESYRQSEANYVARDDYAVTEIFFMMYGDFDFTVIGDCAARFDGTIFDHQTSKMLSPEEFLRRVRVSGT